MLVTCPLAYFSSNTSALMSRAGSGSGAVLGEWVVSDMGEMLSFGLSAVANVAFYTKK
jgi:hypothetical protein